MKYPDMNQYIILLFSLLAEFFFCHTEPNPLARETGPRVPTRAPETVVRERLLPNGAWRGEPSWHVARGPVPRERSTCAKTARQPRPFSRPRHGEGQALALR